MERTKKRNADLDTICTMRNRDKATHEINASQLRSAIVRINGVTVTGYATQSSCELFAQWRKQFCAASRDAIVTWHNFLVANSSDPAGYGYRAIDR